MSKVNLELSEDEAKRYFRKKPIVKLSHLKKIQPKVWGLIAIGLMTTILLIMFMEWRANSEYERGYNYAKSEITKAQNYQALQDKSLNYVWEWFLKRSLITLGYGLPLLLLVMAIVWIIHGGFFKIM